jgi:amino-acid N-acetyltransferase
MADSFKLRCARTDDLQRIQSLLAACELPTADIKSHLAQFVIAERDGELGAVGGLELYGRVGLLRSIAVTPSQRRTGLATRLCRELMARATEQGVRELYLLTDTAEGFFARLSFTRVDRDAAPAAIQTTREFRELCAESSILMRRLLA